MGATRARVPVTATDTDARPGTCVAALRVASPRDGVAATAYARPLNLASVRVVCT
jgi:hypothetical protein